MEHKFEINEEVWYVKDFHITKSKVLEVALIKNNDGEKLVYTIQFVKNEKQGRAVEAELVKDFDVAKNSALLNWRRINEGMMKQLTECEQSDFEPEEKDDE